MALALDTATNGGSGVGTSLSYAHTCTGSNLILFVGVNLYNPGTDDLTGITYNSVAMTQIAKQTNTNNAGQISYLYYLINPSTGSNNIVISKNNALATIRSCASSYTGATQSGQPDAFGSSEAGGASPAGTSSVSKSITTIADNCWMVSFSFNDGAQIQADTGTTLRADGTFMAIGDSNAAITPAGAYSMGWKIAAGEARWTQINASFSPFVASTGRISGTMGLMGIGN